MENKKDIGKAISEKLASLDKTPQEQVWSGISYELQKKKKRRIGFFLFWGKITAVLLIGTIAGFFIYYQNSGFNVKPGGKDKNDSVISNGINGETFNGNANSAKSKKANGNTQQIGTATNGENNPNSTNTNNSDSGITNKTNSNDNKIRNGNYHNNKNGIGNNNQVSGKNRFDTNSKFGKGNIGKSLKSKGDKVAAKSSATGNAIGNSSKSANGKSKLLSKYKNSKTGKKPSKTDGTASKTDGNASKNGTPDLTSLQGDTGKNTTTVADLSSLQGNKKGDTTEAEKTKKTDSTATKKEKDKTVNINMYPQDSVKTDPGKKFRKFYVDAFVSPTSYGSLSKGSALDRDLDSLPKKSEVKFSYGFGITYDLTERVSVRVGYSRINLSYVTDNVRILAGNYNGIQYKPNINNETIYTASDSAETMKIKQKISYTEIPVEVKYNFLTKKLGLKSSFGFSYLLLNDNSISVSTWNGFSQEIGKTKNLSATSVSVNLGLEVDYPVFRNTKVFVEPLFNYQVKAFSDGNYQPYIFGVHFGLRYSFNNK